MVRNSPPGNPEGYKEDFTSKFIQVLNGILVPWCMGPFRFKAAIARGILIFQISEFPCHYYPEKDLCFRSLVWLHLTLTLIPDELLFEGQLTINQIYKVPCAVCYNIFTEETPGGRVRLDCSSACHVEYFVMRPLKHPETNRFLQLLPKERVYGNQNFVFLSCHSSVVISLLPATFLLEPWLSSFDTDRLLEFSEPQFSYL